MSLQFPRADVTGLPSILSGVSGTRLYPKGCHQGEGSGVQGLWAQGNFLCLTIPVLQLRCKHTLTAGPGCPRPRESSAQRGWAQSPEEGMSLPVEEAIKRRARIRHRPQPPTDGSFCKIHRVDPQDTSLLVSVDITTPWPPGGRVPVCRQHGQSPCFPLW